MIMMYPNRTPFKRGQKTSGLGWAESACWMSSISTMIRFHTLMKTFPFNAEHFHANVLPTAGMTCLL